MKLVECRKESLRLKNRNHCIIKLLDEFIKSNMDVAMVAYGADEYKGPQSLYSSIRNAIRRNGMKVKVCVRGRNVFLVKLDADA